MNCNTSVTSLKMEISAKWTRHINYNSLSYYNCPRQDLDLRCLTTTLQLVYADFKVTAIIFFYFHKGKKEFLSTLKRVRPLIEITSMATIAA